MSAEPELRFTLFQGVWGNWWRGHRLAHQHQLFRCELTQFYLRYHFATLVLWYFCQWSLLSPVYHTLYNVTFIIWIKTVCMSALLLWSCVKLYSELKSRKCKWSALSLSTDGYVLIHPFSSKAVQRSWCGASAKSWTSSLLCFLTAKGLALSQETWFKSGTKPVLV